MLAASSVCRLEWMMVVKRLLQDLKTCRKYHVDVFEVRSMDRNDDRPSELDRSGHCHADHHPGGVGGTISVYHVVDRMNRMTITYLLPVGSWFGFKFPSFRAANISSIGVVE